MPKSNSQKSLQNTAKDLFTEITTTTAISVLFPVSQTRSEIMWLRAALTIKLRKGAPFANLHNESPSVGFLDDGQNERSLTSKQSGVEQRFSPSPNKHIIGTGRERSESPNYKRMNLIRSLT